MVRKLESLLIFVLAILVIPFVAGEVYQTSTEIDLKQQCFNDGTYCSSSAECNFTIVDPDNIVVINNLAGTNQFSYHNYTLDSWETNTSGVWTYVVTCRDGSEQNFNEFQFTVNPTGIDFSQQRTDAFSRTIYVVIILAILFVITGFFIKGIAPLRWSLYIVGGIFFLVSLNLILVGLRDEVSNENVISLFDIIVASSFYIYWGAAVMIFVIWFLTVLMTLKSIAESKKQRGIIGING